MEIYFASGNEEKKKELSKILEGFTLILPKDCGIDFEVEEDADSFYGNSMKKAKALYDMTKRPVLADDSGLCVKALGGLPGVFSARYAGLNDVQGKNTKQKLPSQKRNALLLEHLNKVAKKGETREASFVCAMTLYIEENVFFACQSCVNGVIVNSTEEQKGKNGFGYDPIFYIPELKKTMAELLSEEKNKISHRAKAASMMKQFLLTLL